MRTVKVPLGDRSYPIYIGAGALSRLPMECARRQLAARCAVISDRNVAPLYGDRVLRSLREAGFDPILIAVPAGEKAKSLRFVQQCYEQLAVHRLERGSFIVALGGGVVGDLAGFVAATYLRGIALVQAPTTLLAQVDSSVGGKVGVNLPAGKNLVGAFYQPRFVLCDLDTLNSLPRREFRAGLAEVIKYGIIYDAALFRLLERDLAGILGRERGVLAAVVARCCAIKADVVRQDETESGLRAILNFGHTIGHAIEAVSGYGKFLHGEAISIGQTAAARISSRILRLRPSDVERITNLFKRADLPTSIQLRGAQRAKLIETMRLDKKVRGGEIKFVLAKRIGHVVWGEKVPTALIEETLDAAGPALNPQPSILNPSRVRC
ncbi:MAG: 3-dehydroquinate synthase [Verrucomicrobia bacterium]|nr:3-dehydroquinate synthase [Verrucomicrobiota bacterium]